MNAETRGRLLVLGGVAIGLISVIRRRPHRNVDLLCAAMLIALGFATRLEGISPYVAWIHALALLLGFLGAILALTGDARHPDSG